MSGPRPPGRPRGTPPRALGAPSRRHGAPSRPQETPSRAHETPSRARPAHGGVEPRDLAARLLASIETRHAFSDKLLAAAFRGGEYPAETRARVNRLVKGVLRRRGELDALLIQRLGPKFAGLPLLMRQILRLGVYQMLEDSGIPRPKVVDETVRLARKYGHPGTAGLANAVLRRLAESGRLEDLLPQGGSPEALAVRYSHPEWLVRRWLERLGQERTERILASNQGERPTFLRSNPFRGGAEALGARLSAEGVAYSPGGGAAAGLLRVDSRFAPPDSPAFNAGLGTIQDPAELQVVRLCDARPGQRWLDLCAAPGGKSTGLAESVRSGAGPRDGGPRDSVPGHSGPRDSVPGHGVPGDGGQGGGEEGAVRVVAADLSLGRLRRARETVLRLGTPGLEFVVADGRRPPFRTRLFDGVLVDAPCSGLGVLARRADARWRKDPRILDLVGPLQAELLEAGASLLGPGGVLVYSVCSFEPEETRERVESFLASHPGFRLDPAGSRLDAELTEDGYYRVLPGEHDTDGAFAARMIRTA